jgi:quercetin dioxygenase-like cupin family protein
MDENKMLKAHIKPAGQSEVLRAYDDTVALHLTGAQNGGAFTMFTDTTPPGGGPPPHFHTLEDEWWFVLAGQPEFFDGNRWNAVAPGGSVFMPRNSLHTFRNAGRGPLKQIIHTSPAGFENFFKRSHDEFQKAGGPDMKRLLEVGAEHGIHFPTLAPGAAAKRGQPTLAPVMVPPGTGQVLRAFGEEVTILLEGSQTGGQFTAFLEVTPPGGGPPPHFHEREHEWFYVLEGCVSFFTDGEWSDAHPGDVVFAPRQGVHTFKNNTGRPTRMLIHTAPSGFEKFFAEAAQEFARPGGPDMNRAVAIAGKYGIRFVPA